MTDGLMLLHIISSMACLAITAAGCSTPKSQSMPVSADAASAQADAITAQADAENRKQALDIVIDSPAGGADDSQADPLDAQTDATADVTTDVTTDATDDAAPMAADAAPEVANPVADPGPPYLLQGGCAIPQPTASPACAMTSCSAGKTCMGAGVCVPTEPFFLNSAVVMQSGPSLAAGPAGTWAIAYAGGGGDQVSAVFFQVFSTTGKGSAPLQLNTLPPGLPRGASVVRLTSGEWLVAWRLQDGFGQTTAYQMRKISPDGGQTIGDVVQLNTTTINLGSSEFDSNAVAPTLSLLRNGNVFAAWIGGPKNLNTLPRVYGRLFDQTGVPLTGELDPTGSDPADMGLAPIALPLPLGEVLLVWQLNPNGKFGNPGLRARVLDIAGNPKSSIIQINPGNKVYEAIPGAATLLDGDLVFSWKASNAKNKTAAVDIMLAHVPAGLNMAGIGTVFKLDHDSEGVAPYLSPVVAAGPHRAAVAWQNLSTLKGPIQLSHYYAVPDAVDCQPIDVSGPGDINESSREMPALAALSDGRLLVAWQTILIGTSAGKNDYKIRLRFAE